MKRFIPLLSAEDFLDCEVLDGEDFRYVDEQEAEWIAEAANFALKRKLREEGND